MGKIIAVVNQKGGVGKTTTAVNLTAALTALGVKVLLCDFDPQANATSGMGVDKRRIRHSVYDVVINDVPVTDAIVHTDYGDILPSGADLAGAAVELMDTPHREGQLEKALHSIRNNYDVIFIDCPPSLELLTLNGLCAADGILVPVQCEYFALEGALFLLTDIMSPIGLYYHFYFLLHYSHRWASASGTASPSCALLVCAVGILTAEDVELIDESYHAV